MPTWQKAPADSRAPGGNDRLRYKAGGGQEKDFKITRYKDTIIKGWLGEYYLNGDPELLRVALDAGLGAKNSQGYGCCELVI